MRSYLPTISLKTILSVSSAMVGILLIIFLVLYTHHTKPPVEQPAATASFPKPVTINADSLRAKSAVLYDPATGKILYAKNADLTMPLASLTKLMTANVVLHAVATNTLITLSKKDVSVEGDAGDWNLKAGDTLTLSNIVKLALNSSSNHAMSAAAAALGADYVGDLNKSASSLGLSHTYFLNPTGLDLTTETSGAYGSASDVAHLAAAFMHDYPDFFEQSTQQSVTVPVSSGNTSRQVTVAATALPILNEPGIIGVKTGYTDLAGGNLVVAFDLEVNHPVIAVVLGSTQQGRFDDMRTLINASRNAQD